jgi:hypothetical protein
MKHDTKDKKSIEIQPELLENELGEQFGKLSFDEKGKNEKKKS